MRKKAITPYDLAMQIIKVQQELIKILLTKPTNP